MPPMLGPQGTNYCAGLLVEMGILITFCLGWLGTIILPIPTSQVAGITDVTTAPRSPNQHFYH
jgi:hypothetical protein